MKLHTDDGLVGLGEASCTPRWSGEDQVSAAHFINTYFAPALVGHDPTRIDEVSRAVFPLVAGNFFTKAAVEMALWDLAGKAAGKPVYELLGGKVRDVDGDEVVGLGAAAGAGRRDRALGAEPGLPGDEGEGRPRRRRRLRPGRRPSARSSARTSSWAWTPTAAGATRPPRSPPSSGSKPLGIAFAEQPVWAGDPEEMAAVRRACGVPIVADESLYTLADARQLARAGACDVFSIYIGKAGGIGPARAIADFALEQGIACTIGSNLELGVGSAAMIHLGLAHRGITPDAYPCDIIGPFFYEDDILEEPLALGGGRAAATDRPGLGVELDEAKVEKYRIG